MHKNVHHCNAHNVDCHVKRSHIPFTVSKYVKYVIKIDVESKPYSGESRGFPFVLDVFRFHNGSTLQS